MKRKSARRYKRKSSNKSFNWLAIVIILILVGTISYKGLQKSHVLGIKFLAQEMTSEQQQMMQQYQQQQSQPQQQQQPAQQQPMSQEQMQQQMTQEQKQQMQQYQQQGPASNTYNQQQTSGSTGNYNNPANSTNNQPVPTQYQQQYQQNLQMYQQTQLQWQQEAAKNGFQISNISQQQYLQNFQDINNKSGSQNSSALPSFSSFPSIQGQFNVTSANNTKVNLNNSNTKIQLGSQNASLEYKAVTKDGTQYQIDKSEFEKINSAIKLETGSEISKSGDSFVMKRGQTEAQTKFPISFNVATKTFSVQTPAGEKEIAVLPDQAVGKALQNGAISKVQTSTNGQTTSSLVQLTELNNQPVYEVQGSTQQKMFGFLPIAIPKTTFVSAETGNVVSTNQNIFSRFLDTISF